FILFFLFTIYNYYSRFLQNHLVASNPSSSLSIPQNSHLFHRPFLYWQYSLVAFLSCLAGTSFEFHHNPLCTPFFHTLVILLFFHFFLLSALYIFSICNIYYNNYI